MHKTPIASLAVYWKSVTRTRNLDGNIRQKRTVEECLHCQIHRNAQRSVPLIPRAMPDRPLQTINVNLQYYMWVYLVVLDQYSRWLEIIKLTTITTGAVILELRELFSCWDIHTLLDVIMGHCSPALNSSNSPQAVT